MQVQISDSSRSTQFIRTLEDRCSHNFLIAMPSLQLSRTTSITKKMWMDKYHAKEVILHYSVALKQIIQCKSFSKTT